MKKLTVIAALIISVLCITGCSGGTTISSFSSSIFNTDEFDEAVETVQTEFSNFEGCTMSEISYAGDEATREEAEARGLAPEQVMVIKTTFTTDDNARRDSLDPDSTYEDYTWILTRNSTGEPWTVIDHGYA